MNMYISVHILIIVHLSLPPSLPYSQSMLTEVTSSHAQIRAEVNSLQRELRERTLHARSLELQLRRREGREDDGEGDRMMDTLRAQLVHAHVYPRAGAYTSAQTYMHIMID